MEKEIKELSKAETSAESEYPEELREQAETALLLVAVKHTRFDCKTSSTLAKLKRKFLGAPSHDQPQTEDSRNHLEGGTIDLASRNHLEGATIDLAPRNLSGELPQGRPEHISRMLKSYNPPDIPSVPSLNNELIERCSKPFEKQLSASDLKDSQSRLTISKSDAENHLYPLLNEGENLARRIEVNTCGPDGKQFGMMFKIWGGKTHVLFGKWRAFYNEYDLQSHQDFVTVWMFRRRDTRTLCFDDQVEQIALFSTNPLEKTGE